jgi:hypothetical protein
MSGNTTRVSGRHPVAIGHLVMGLAFLGIVGIWALIQGDVVTGDDIRWLLPLPWIVAGIAGLVASAVTGTRRYSVRQTGWANAPDTTSTTDDTDLTDNHQNEDPEENR